jgi:hypothetical protein
MAVETNVENKLETIIEETTSKHETRPDWRPPLLTRIDIKRTLYSSGSNIDLHGGNTPG